MTVAVRSALEVYPVPFGVEEAVRQQWTENLLTRAADLNRRECKECLRVASTNRRHTSGAVDDLER